MHNALVARATLDPSLRAACDVCEGRTTTRTVGPDRVSTVDTPCPRCRGRGWNPRREVPDAPRYSFGSDNNGGIHLAVDAQPLLRLSRDELLAMLREADRAPTGPNVKRTTSC